MKAWVASPKLACAAALFALVHAVPAAGSADPMVDETEPGFPRIPTDNGYDPHETEPSFPANRTRYIGAQSFEAQIIDRDISATRSDSPRSLVARFGYFLNPYVSLEGRLGFGTGIESGDARIDRMGGLFANAYWPFNDRVAIYVLAGGIYAEGSSRADSDNRRRSWSGAGASYGAGINLFTRGGFGVYAEYVWYLDEDVSTGNVEIEGLGLGGQIAF